MKKNITKIIILTMLSVALVSTIASAATYSGSYNGQIGTQFGRTAYVPSASTTFAINPNAGEGYMSVSSSYGLVYDRSTSSYFKYSATSLVSQNGTFRASAQSTYANGSATLVVQ